MEQNFQNFYEMLLNSHVLSKSRFFQYDDVAFFKNPKYQGALIVLKFISDFPNAFRLLKVICYSRQICLSKCSGLFMFRT